MPPMLSDQQKSRGARAILGWTQKDLAKVSGVSFQTICTFENSQHALHPNNLSAVWKAFTNAGIQFTNYTVGFGNSEEANVQVAGGPEPVDDPRRPDQHAELSEPATTG